jgi:uncharacterized protein DUF3268
MSMMQKISTPTKTTKRKAKPVMPPLCASCSRPARLTTGAEIYAHRRDLHGKQLWKCDGCGGYVGCHGSTTRPLGTPAGFQLRDARAKLHDLMIDPLWKTADQSDLYEPEDDKARMVIRNAARVRVYAYLAHRLGIGREDCHVAMFDLAMCRKAWTELRDVDYPYIRRWYRDHKEDAEKAAA